MKRERKNKRRKRRRKSKPKKQLQRPTRRKRLRTRLGRKKRRRKNRRKMRLIKVERSTVLETSSMTHRKKNSPMRRLTIFSVHLSRWTNSKNWMTTRYKRE